MSSISAWNCNSVASNPAIQVQLGNAVERRAELLLTVSLVALPIILSAAGLVSSSVLIVAAVGSAKCMTMLLINSLREHFFGNNKPDEKAEQYSAKVLSHPFETGIVTPILEEAIFRGGIQTALTYAFRAILPAASLTVGALTLPYATAAAIVVAGTIFGLAHLGNGYDGAKYQAMYTTVGGLIYGYLFYQYGLWAPILAHAINNTIAMSIGELQIEANRHNQPQAIRV